MFALPQEASSSCACCCSEPERSLEGSLYCPSCGPEAYMTIQAEKMRCICAPYDGQASFAAPDVINRQLNERWELALLTECSSYLL